MELSWPILTLALMLNAIACLTQYAVERWEAKRGRIASRHSRIPGTDDQKFLYWEDFHTQTWGDFFGVGLIWAAFAHIIAAGALTGLGLSLFIVITITDMRIFRMLCLKKGHKPDWGFPTAGKMSWGGATHLPYHGLSVAAFCVCTPFTFGEVSHEATLWLYLTGMIIYSAAFGIDVADGRFDPLKATPNGPRA